jgi:acyl-coenzyme A synthetase/AMP-(fatty) acid ligase
MDSFILNNLSSDTDLGILDFLNKIKNKESIVFTTSGTTGTPKEIIHTYESLIRNIKIRKDLNKSIWGLTYDYKKIAGSQVILQCYLNNGKLINLCNKSKDETIRLILDYNVTHLSATPTFYRLLVGEIVFKNIIQITIGGETIDSNLIDKIKKTFPNANIRNIYASTEFGTLFTSNTYYFEISEKNRIFVKILNNHIHINQNDYWVDTGDVVEMIDDNKFKIIGRETNMINVGGVKINPIQVENVINGLDYVSNCYVYGKENSVMGMVVVADIVLLTNISVSQIKIDLIDKLTKYETPLKLNIVDTLKINSTGKIIRR